MKKTALMAILLAGCTTQSGVIPEGKDAYLVIMSPGYGFTSLTDLRIRAHKQAGAFCGGLNKRPETISERTLEAGITSDHPEETLKFRCVAAGDTQEAATVSSAGR